MHTRARTHDLNMEKTITCMFYAKTVKSTVKKYVQSRTITQSMTHNVQTKKVHACLAQEKRSISYSVTVLHLA